jgi:hypothetical protein
MAKNMAKSKKYGICHIYMVIWQPCLKGYAKKLSNTGIDPSHCAYITNLSGINFPLIGDRRFTWIIQSFLHEFGKNALGKFSIFKDGLENNK